MPRNASNKRPGHPDWYPTECPPVCRIIPPYLQERRFLVIGISGRMFSGKNYLLDECLKPWLVQEQGISAVSLSYAKPLKFDVMRERWLSFQSVFREKDTVTREALIDKGLVKRDEDPAYWIHQLHLDLLFHLDNGAQVILVTDNRFLNEFRYIRHVFPGRSLLIRVEAPQRVKRKMAMEYVVVQSDGFTVDEPKTAGLLEKLWNNPSEIQGDQYHGWDVVIDNDFGNQENSAGDLQTFVEAHPVSGEFSDEVQKKREQRRRAAENKRRQLEAAGGGVETAAAGV